ncbi:MAG: hypothetical protein KAJ55_00320 [Anaerolineales bacterium]|nr:hypothetical protein [Anaerolineales bacterium]
MSQVGNISRTPADISTVVHENYVNEVKPMVDLNDPVSALFTKIGPGGYTLIGEKLQFALDDSYAGGFMGTDGYLPDHQQAEPVEAFTTPARLYIRRAVDNFTRAFAVKPGAYEDFFARINKQMLDAVKRGTAYHIHGSTNATVCTFVSRTSATVLVVEAGFGHASQAALQFVEPGMYMALLDANSAYATIGAAEVLSIVWNTSATTATITFAADIDTSTVGADGDPLVFASSSDTTATNYIVERGKAPLGLIDFIDPDATATSLLGLSEATAPRWTPSNQASADFGHVEMMEFMEFIAARSTSEVSTETHVFTMQNGVKIELAKDLLPFQQQTGLGRTLQGGWNAVKVGDFDVVTSNYHLWDVVYCLCPMDIHVVDLDGEPSVWSGDGSPYNRLADYDGIEWFLKHYVQRFPSRRNRMGALTGVTNPNKQNYSAHPVV